MLPEIGVSMVPDRKGRRSNRVSLAAWLSFVTLFYVWWNPPFIPIAFSVSFLRNRRPAGKRSGYQRWMTGFVSLLIVALTVVGCFNFVMDPLWCFDTDFPWNRRQIVFNGRQQKTNKITLNRFDYRTLLTGSSRVNCLNQNDFGDLKAYNYALSAMMPDEYPDYVRYAKKRNGREFGTIVLGVDFFGTNANMKHEFESPEHYISAANSLLYRYKMLLSSDVLGFSVDNVMHGFKRDVDLYDRSNVRIPKAVTRAEQERIIREQLLWFEREGYGRRYRYDENLGKKLLMLRRDNPNTGFIVFTTPVAQPLFCLLVSENRLPDYERWLRELVSVFGRFYHFMDLNTVTVNYLETFSDAHHTTPSAGRLITSRILGHHNHAVPADFGKLVTAENIERIIAGVRAQCAVCTGSLPPLQENRPAIEAAGFDVTEKGTRK